MALGAAIYSRMMADVGWYARVMIVPAGRTEASGQDSVIWFSGRPRQDQSSEVLG